MDTRPPIPAEIRRRVLVEAGHRCAIPTCRVIEVEVHHIVPWSEHKAHEYDNLIALCPTCHSRATKGEIDRKSMRLYKLNLRFIHDKYSQLEMDILFELYKLPRGHGVQWLPVLMIFLKRTLEAGLIQVHANQRVGAIIAGLNSTPQLLVLTDKSRSFLDDLGIREL